MFLSDILLLLERSHLLRLVAWGTVSVLTGVALLAWRLVRRNPDAALLHFALQCAIWGIVVLGLGVAGLGTLESRDAQEAIQLTNRVWLNTGLAIGYTAVGLTLALCGWRLGRRAGLVGAGTGVFVQGSALLALELRFLSTLSQSAE